MNWLSNMILDLQKRFLGGDEPMFDDGAAQRHLVERRTAERVQQLQWRLQELDRRLARLK